MGINEFQTYTLDIRDANGNAVSFEDMFPSQREKTEAQRKYGNWEGEPEVPPIRDSKLRRPEYLELEKMVAARDREAIENRMLELHESGAPKIVISTYAKEGILMGSIQALAVLVEYALQGETFHSDFTYIRDIWNILLQMEEFNTEENQDITEFLEDVIRNNYVWFDMEEHLEEADRIEQEVRALEVNHDPLEEWYLYEEYYFIAEWRARRPQPSGDFQHPIPHKYHHARMDWHHALDRQWDMDYQESAENAPQEEEQKEKQVVSDIENLDGYFEGLLGMELVQEQLDRIYQSVKMQILRNNILKEQGQEPTENKRGYNFILLGNPGTGKTTVARIIAKVLHDIGIRSSDKLIEVDRSRLVSNHIGGTETKVRGILGTLDGGTLFIDEAYTMYKENDEADFGTEAIHTLMKDMEDNRDSYSVILAGYREPMLNMIKNANYGFSSRFTYQIELPDYDIETLLSIAHVEMEKQKFSITEGVDEAIEKCIRRDKIDSTFGNARYIRELVNQAIDNQSHRLHNESDYEQAELFILRPQDFWIESFEEESIEHYLQELEQLTGLASVKAEVNSLISMILVQKEMERRGIPSDNNPGTLHMVFKGNPGTGKTTVARILGKIYASLGILKRGDVFVECSRGDLVGEYQGHTAVKVKKMIQSALGGILFIDEAYALVQSEGDSFGHEALDTLVAEMENNRDSLVVILAGYSRDMDEFFQNNPGLYSRVPRELHFEDYNDCELYEIALHMLEKKHMKCSDTVKEALYAKLVQENNSVPDYGNARGVRNTVENICRKQNVRISELLRQQKTEMCDEDFLTIEAEDIYE